MHSTAPAHVLRIGYFGFNERDQRVLRTVAAISALPTRQWAYTFAEGAEAADILLVDSTDPQAVYAWMAVHRQYPLLPTLIATPQSLPQVHFYRMDYPLVVMDVIKTLDDIARREFPNSDALCQPQAA